MTVRTPVDTSNRVYRGAPGRTRKVQVHYSCPCGNIITADVYRSVDISAQPELKQRIRAQDPGDGLNSVTCPGTGEPVRIEVPVVYHDSDNRLFVLVLPESARHRELAERAALLDQLADDPSPVPRYVRQFEVAFGVAELNALIERKDEEVGQAQRLAEQMEELRRERDELAEAHEDLERRAAKLELLATDLTRRANEMQERERELERKLASHKRLEEALDTRARLLREAEEALATGGVSGGFDEDESDEVHATTAVDTQAIGEEQNPFNLFEDDDEVSVSSSSLTKGRVSEVITGIEDVKELDESDAEELDESDLMLATSEIITSSEPPPPREEEEDDDPPEIVTLVSEITDVAVERWSLSGEPTLQLVSASGDVRIAATVDKYQAEALVSDRLDATIQLHRFPSFPLVNLGVGSPALLDSSDPAREPIHVFFNVSVAEDRAVLQALEREFTFAFEIYDHDYELIRKRTYSADLAENVRFVLSAADEHLSRIGDGERSYDKAEIAFTNPDYDRYGWKHPERSEFRADKLATLTTARHVRRALAIADRFSSPKREVYLFMLHGYPLARWRTQRREVLAAAVDMGLWMGDRLAHIAVSEGLARSRKDLVKALHKHFKTLTESVGEANDLDSDAISDNWSALRKEADSLGIKRSAGKRGGKKRRVPRKTPIQSAVDAVVSGTIAETTSRALRISQARNQPIDELMAQLNDPKKRAQAAVELARRRERRAIDPVMSVVAKMNRTDAVGVLAATASFGDPATDSLVKGLTSNKSFIRQGCALALSVLKNEAAIEALSDQLISEPTALWREIARGLGVVGPPAIMSLASRVAQSGEATARERVAWALAHIASRGGDKQVKQLAKGRDSVASGVAKHALELITMAKSDDLQVRGQNTPKEQTVNRAFSRRFFQALEASTPLVDPSVTGILPDMSAPAMVLDEADLLEATELDDDGAELLDESDLLPT